MKKTFTFFFKEQFNMKKLLTLIVLFGIGGQAFAQPTDSAHVNNTNTDTTKIRTIQRSLPSPLPDLPFPT
ncbi:hypothetical protein, partial [Mucilaginibacter sp.]